MARARSKSKASRGSATVYQLKITLKGARPPIWRRLLVPSDTTFDRLHGYLQSAMGWTNSHLHQFIVGDRYIGAPSPDDSEGMEVENEKRVPLSAVAGGAKARFIYEYDFGDSWEHEIVVEKVLAREDGMRYPVCVAGARPPEDCGGVWGYASLLQTLSNPRHPEYREMKEWAGDIDPERFDLDVVNKLLRGPPPRNWALELGG